MWFLHKVSLLHGGTNKCFSAAYSVFNNTRMPDSKSCRAWSASRGPVTRFRIRRRETTRFILWDSPEFRVTFQHFLFSIPYSDKYYATPCQTGWWVLKCKQKLSAVDGMWCTDIRQPNSVARNSLLSLDHCLIITWFKMFQSIFVRYFQYYYSQG